MMSILLNNRQIFPYTNRNRIRRILRNSIPCSFERIISAAHEFK